MPDKFPKLPFRLGEGGNWCEGMREQGKMSFSPPLKATKGNSAKKKGPKKGGKKGGY